jgi:HSP20 family protein
MIPVIRTYHRVPNIIDELFGNDTYGGKTESYTLRCKPAVNVVEQDNAYQIDVAAPGFERSELKVTMDKNLLTISSVPAQKQEEKKEKFLKKEYSTSSFTRSFELPENIDADKIEASHKNGVLSITVPKKAKVEIPVQDIEIK